MSGQRIKSIVKLFEACRYKHDLYTIFSDFCECAAIAMSNAVDLGQRKAREACYLEIVGRYERDVIETFPKILGEVTLAMEDEPSDVLGAVFHALELHNKARGQYFTLFEICRFMARIQMGDPDAIRQIIVDKGYLTAHEPAVGAGALIIALAEAMAEAGFNYQRHLYVVAVDIDRRAAHMAYIQFSLMHIPAIVIVGDSLCLTQQEIWYTPAHILGGSSPKLEATPSEKDTSVESMPERPAPADPVRPKAVSKGPAN